MNLEKDKISKLLLHFCIPAMVGMFVQSMYNVVDRIFVSKGVSELAFSGLTVTFPMMLIIMGFAMLIGIGSAAILSIRLGEKDFERARLTVGNAFVMLIIIGVILQIVAFIFLDEMLLMFGASEDTLDYASRYMRIILAGTPISILGFGMNHVMRASGQPRLSMTTNIIGALTNVVLDWLFIYIFHWSIEGAAIATVIAQLISCTWVLSYFFNKKNPIRITRESLKLRFDIVLSACKIGISSFTMQVVGSLVNIIANNALQTYGGDSALASMGAVMSISTIFFMPLFGINQGCQPIIGYNHGAKRFDRVKKTLLYAIGAGTVICVLGFIIIQIFADTLVLMFANSTELIEMSSNALRIYLLAMPVVGFQIIGATFYQATNRAKIALFLSTTRQMLLLIPCYFILPRFFGLNGIWYAGPVSDGISAVITFVMVMISLKELDKHNAKNTMTV